MKKKPASAKGRAIEPDYCGVMLRFHQFCEDLSLNYRLELMEMMNMRMRPLTHDQLRSIARKNPPPQSWHEETNG